MIDDPNKPAWAGNFFTGIPAPAGAITVLLPIYLNFLGVSNGLVTVWLTFFYTLAIALLMVSRLPVFSGKRVGKRVPPEMVLPVFVVVVLFFALLISYPWEVLTLGTLAYLGCLPLGWLSYREYQRKDAGGCRPTPLRRRTGAQVAPRPCVRRSARRSRAPGAPELSTEPTITDFDSLRAERIAGHQVVGMLPAGQRLHALEPGADRRMSPWRYRSRILRPDSRDSRSSKCRRWSACR